MKEDVLEQVVEDYLQHRGYLTRHNLRFRPRRDDPGFVSADDSVSSDVDVIGLNPRESGTSRVWVVSCKSWQSGFNPEAKLRELRGEKSNPKRATWKSLRELWIPKWAEAFRAAVLEATGEERFHYSLAVTRLNGRLSEEEAATQWRSDPTINSNLPGCEFSFLTMRGMWHELQESMTTTPASSEIGRLAQLLKAAGIDA